MLVDAIPPIEENGAISEEVLMREIRRRFAPGESHKEAEIILEKHLHKSTTQTLQYALVDFFHARSKVPAAIGSSAQSIVSSLWSVAGLGGGHNNNDDDQQDEDTK